MANSNLITVSINPAELVKLSEDGKKFLITKNAEQGLLKLLELESRVAEAKEAVKDFLSEQMDKNNTLKIEGEAISVIKQFFGDRYEVYDRDLAQGFTKVVTSTKIDTDAVDAYQKANGKLPDGVRLRERVKKCIIREKKRKEKNAEITA